MKRGEPLPEVRRLYDSAQRTLDRSRKLTNLMLPSLMLSKR